MGESSVMDPEPDAEESNKKQKLLKEEGDETQSRELVRSTATHIEVPRPATASWRPSPCRSAEDHAGFKSHCRVQGRGHIAYRQLSHRSKDGYWEDRSRKHRAGDLDGPWDRSRQHILRCQEHDLSRLGCGEMKQIFDSCLFYGWIPAFMEAHVTSMYS